MPDVLILVFSKDRPLQLDGTLTSLRRHCRDAGAFTPRVLYTTSTSRARSLYCQVMREHPDVHFVREQDFRRDLLLLLQRHEFVLFVVDDSIFVRDFMLDEFANALRRHKDAIGVSLRLGRNANYCYALDKPQGIPELHPFSDTLLTFRWPGAECDFGYPLEVSSSLYRSADLLPLLRELPFSNPNTLEAGLANRAGHFHDSHPQLLCPPVSLAFSAPINLVQQVCDNRVGKREQFTAAALNDRFAAGCRIDVSRFDGFTPTGCHQEVDLPLANTAAATPMVSVVMPCYRQGEFLQEAVGSVVGQTFADWELIIVNDGSPDDTSAVASRLMTAYPDKSIRLIEKANGGVSSARNTGIAAARGAYILPLDADDLIRPTMLEKTVAVLEQRPDVAIAYTDITHFGVADLTIQAAEFDAEKIPHGNQLNCCSLYRREAWELCGGYRPFHWGYEDWDFWVNCTAHGLRARRIPESLLLYRVKDSSRDTVAVEHDRELRARIVLNHPRLYSPKRIEEASATLQASPMPDVPSSPLVSVIVPTFNRPELLCEAIDSILGQTLQNFEIIVINDAGIDVTGWIAGRDTAGRIRYLQHPTNRGIAAARNTGLNVARGTYIAYLDDDDIYYKDHLAVLVREAETTGQAVVYSEAFRAIYTRHEGSPATVERAVIYPGGFSLGDLLVRNRLPTLSVLHRRSCIDSIGGFDETLESHEDWDLWIRLFHQYPHSHVKQTTSEFRVNHGEGSITSSRLPSFYRTMKIIHQRYRKWADGMPGVRRAQQNDLRSLAEHLYQTGSPVDTWGRLRRAFRRMAA
jgi:glycosyltransferase involved in cell wall biosynthesis